MARELSKKRRGFVNVFADTGIASLAVKKNYKVKNDETARAMGSELLTMPNVIEALDELGFNEKSAKSVVVEIMEDKEADANARLKATDQVFKVEGSYAPEKSQALNLNVEARLEDKSGLEALRSEYEEKLKAKLLK